MAVKCKACGSIVGQTTFPMTCPACSADATNFERVEMPLSKREHRQHDRDRAFLEGRRES